MAGAVVEFIFNIEPADISNLSIKDGKTGSKEQQEKRTRPIRERIAGQSLLATWAAAGVVVLVLVGGFVFFAPLTYGKPGLDVEQVLARKWLNYDLHFAK